MMMAKAQKLTTQGGGPRSKQYHPRPNLSTSIKTSLANCIDMVAMSVDVLAKSCEEGCILELDLPFQYFFKTIGQPLKVQVHAEQRTKGRDETRV
jgi:hypothetical protein